MMFMKNHFLMYNILTFLVTTQSGEVVGSCSDALTYSYKDSRLNATVIKAKGVPLLARCVTDCVSEPCCRSINYNKGPRALQNGTNCEMLHDVVNNISQAVLQKNASYHYVQLIDPQKEYNHSCLSKYLDENIRVPVLGSVILSSEPLEISNKLKEWLPKTGNWSVCWRATRDGWDVTTTFHPNCDGKKPTLTLVKVVQHGKKYIFGGYATESWDGHGPTSATGSFLFSLRNNDDLAPFKASLRNQNDGDAIHRRSNIGPTFGKGLDLHIANKAIKNTNFFTNFGFTYQAPPGYSFGSDNTQSLLAGSYYFTPSEVEVLFLSD